MMTFFGWLGSMALALIVMGGLIECCSRMSRREVHVFHHVPEEPKIHEGEIVKENSGGVQPSEAWSRLAKENALFDSTNTPM